VVGTPLFTTNSIANCAVNTPAIERFALKMKQRRTSNAYQRWGGMLRTDVFSVERGQQCSFRYK
jgi:hypothetical protein